MSQNKIYCIQWINSQFETHTGPELWTQPAYSDYRGDFDTTAPQIEDPRPKTLEEAQAQADNMNTSPEFNNTTHKVIIYKGKRRADKPAPKGAIEEFTPVFLLPSAKIERPRVTI